MSLIFLALCSVCIQGTFTVPRATKPVYIAALSGHDSGRGQARNTVQFMITNKMKGILVNNLMYTEDEVDRMDPEVARIVIEKNLKRPAKGMPRAWDVNFGRDVGISSRVYDAIKIISDRSVSVLTSDTAMYLGCAGTAIYALKGVSNILAHRRDQRSKGQEAIQTIRTIPFRDNHFDLRYLENLQRRSILDTIGIAIDVIKNRFS